MRAFKAVVKVLLGLSLGVVLAEFAFSIRDHGAFPHVNYYLLDDQLGVRLEPNASMKLQVAGTNPVTTAATNSLGYRTPEWPDETENAVLVVGDSQVFGLGVEANETFSAKLADQLGVKVLNAGVPTYGPREYTAVVERELRKSKRKIGTVVYVLNLANDLFEVERPNTTRHRVWDGWAVRTETAPREVTAFPFRRELMSKSHLVFALRQWMSASAPANEGFSTEGTWKDVVQAGTGVTPLPPEDEGARKVLAARSELDKQLEEIAGKIEGRIEEKADTAYADDLKAIAPKAGDPRDILQVRFAEGARRVDVTAYHLFMAAVGEARNEKLLLDIAKKSKDADLTKLVEARRELRAKLDALKPEGESPHVEPMDVVLQKTKEACDAAGAKLVVVALPLDVMVNADEWKKYAVPPIDMSATKVLTEDLVSRAERMGALGVDPTAALAAAEPGAFLDGDLHMTPKGHAALATAIVEAMRRPAKPKTTLGLPEGRSWPPTDDEFRRVEENLVKGSTAAGCETKQVREWLRLVCHPKAIVGDDQYDEDELEGIELLAGGHGDARTWREESGTVLLIPLVKGDVASARFTWRASQQMLSLRDDQYAFGKVEKRGKQKVTMPTWRQRLAKPGDPLSPPTCPAGQIAGGAMLQCAPTCDAKRPCATGHCEPWPAGDFCAVP